MKKLRAALAVFVLALAAATPVLAEEEDAGAAAYQQFDTWMRALALNQRCNILHYFEVQQIGLQADAAARQTPAGQDYADAMAWPDFDQAEYEYNQMLDMHRTIAAAAVADAACTTANADIAAVRGAYVRDILKHLYGSYDSSARKQDTEGRRAASEDLIKYLVGLYGSSAQALLETLGNELVAENANPDAEWASLKTVIGDVLWEKRLRENGYAFTPVPGAPGRFRAVKKDGTGEFPAEFGAAMQGDYHDKLDAVIDIDVTVARGWTDDGRFVILLSKDAADWGAGQLRADLLVQDEPNGLMWQVSDWRSRTTAYTAEQPPAGECPTDFCFIFPAEVTDAVRIRQAAGGAFAYELYIAPPALFPLDKVSRPDQRERYLPPAAPPATSGH